MPGKPTEVVDLRTPQTAVRPNSTLEAMRGSPQADWTIPDVKKLCRQLDLTFTKPTRGTHFKVSSPRLEGILMVPARRPIKSAYIRSLVALADAHIEAGQEATI